MASRFPHGAYFDWSVLDGKGLLSNGDFSGRATNTVSFTAPAVNTDTTFGLQVFVQDAATCGTKYPIDLIVLDTAGNNDPIVVLTYDVEDKNISGTASNENVSVPSPATIHLDASGSGDPDSDPITFAWQQNNQSLTSGSTIFSTNGSAATLTALSETNGPVTVTVTVSDDRGGQTSQNLIFDFSDDPPVADARAVKDGAEVSGPLGNGEEFDLDGSGSTPPKG